MHHKDAFNIADVISGFHFSKKYFVCKEAERRHRTCYLHHLLTLPSFHLQIISLHSYFLIPPVVTSIYSCLCGKQPEDMRWQNEDEVKE